MIRKDLLLFIVCLAGYRLEARVVETAHVEDIVPFIDEDTWFLVDLDNCMFQGAQALGHANWFYDEIQQRTQKGMSQQDAIRDFYPTWSNIQKICRVKPVEEAFISVLHQIEARGITIMGLTHRQPSIADSTIRQVGSLGFDFQRTAPSKRYV